MTELLHRLFKEIDESDWTMHWRGNTLELSQRVWDRKETDTETLDKVRDILDCEKPWIQIVDTSFGDDYNVKAEFDVEDFKERIHQ